MILKLCVTLDRWDYTGHQFPKLVHIVLWPQELCQQLLQTVSLDPNHCQNFKVAPLSHLWKSLQVSINETESVCELWARVGTLTWSSGCRDPGFLGNTWLGWAIQNSVGKFKLHIVTPLSATFHRIIAIRPSLLGCVSLGVSAVFGRNRISSNCEMSHKTVTGLDSFKQRTSAGLSCRLTAVHC